MPASSPRSAASIPVASRVDGFTYAIRNIVAEAKKVEASGRTVKYLNIGDPIPFGFKTPPHLVEAVIKAMRDGQNGYGPSPGIQPAREAVAADFTRRGVPMPADRVVLTSGTSEGIEIALNALANPGDEVLVPMPTYPLYTAVMAKIGAKSVYYRKNPKNGWLPDVEEIRSLITPRTRALVVIDPNNPTGAIYPESIRRELLALADQHGFVLLADEVYDDLTYGTPAPPMASLDTNAPVISFGSLSKAYLAPGWRAGWMAIGTNPRIEAVVAAIRKLADGRLCATVPMQHAITAALTGDRSHQVTFRAELEERAKVTVARISAMRGMTCVPPKGAFYVMPQVALPPGKTDEDYVLALLREAGVLCVHGSGFGMPADQGFFRVVFLANPEELGRIYDTMAQFTADFLSRG